MSNLLDQLGNDLLDQSGSPLLDQQQGAVPLVITRQPTNRTGPHGSILALYCEATGTNPVTYQWYENAVLMAGETGTQLILTSSPSINGNTYYCIVSDASPDSLQSDTATVTTFASAEDGIIDVRVLNELGEWVSIMGEDGEDGSVDDLINDNKIVKDLTWSSEKINDELQAVINRLPHALYSYTHKDVIYDAYFPPKARELLAYDHFSYSDFDDADVASHFKLTTRMNFMDDWAAGTYYVDDVVVHSGFVWIALNETSEEPTDIAAGWRAFARDASAIDHDDLINVTPDQHHAQDHAHDGLDGSGTVAHANLTGITADDHHNQLHSHDGLDGSGTVPHANLTGITENDHHNRQHDHSDPADGTVDHSSLSGITADDHHPKLHAHDGLDGSGTVSHADLTGITADDHHAKAHAHDGLDGSGTVAHADLTGITPDDHHNRQHDHSDPLDGTISHTVLADITPDDHHNELHTLGSHTDVETGLGVALATGQGLWYDADTATWFNRSAYEESWPTGLANGGELNIGPGVNDIEVIAGLGVITNSYTDPLSPPTVQGIQWDQINTPITAAPSSAGSVVWFSLADSGIPHPTASNVGPPINTGTLKQYAAPPGPSLARAEIFLGVAVHNGVEWKEVSNPKVINQAAETLREVATTVLDLTTIISGGATRSIPLFQLEQDEGVVWENNRNWHVDKSNPNRETLPAQSPITFQYVNRDFTSVGAPTNTVDPSQYDDAGSITPIPGSSANTSIQRLYIDPANNYWMLWGQNYYASFADGMANLDADTANTVVPFILQNSILLGYVVSEKGKIDWDQDEAIWVPDTGGASGGAVPVPVTEFISLIDTPATYSAHRRKVTKVDDAETLLEFDYRTKGDAYVQGNTYYPQEMVFQDGWLMMANAITTDYPAPVPVGSPVYTLPDIPVFTTYQDTSVIYSGHLYTFNTAGYFRALRVWVPELTGTTNYRIVIVVNPNGLNPVYSTINDPILQENAWTVLTADTILVTAGTELLVYIDALNSGSDISPGGTPTDWFREVSSNTAVPAAGNWNTNVQESLLRINEDDADANPPIDLTGIISGSRFTFTDTIDPNTSVTYLATSGETYDAINGVYSWNVTIDSIGTNGAPQAGDRTLGEITIPVAAATKFVGIDAYWGPGTLPPWAGIQSYLQFNGVPQAVQGDEAYGIDIAFQELIASPDWDIYGTPTGVSGGGDGGGLEAHVLDYHDDVDIVSPLNQQALVYDGVSWKNTTLPTGVTDHGALTGLADDDHPHYHTDARGDARYYTKGQLDGGVLNSIYYTEAETDALLALKTDQTEFDLLESSYNAHAADTNIHFADAADANLYLRQNGGWVLHVPPTVIDDHGVLNGLGDDDHPQYHNDLRGDSRYYTKTLLDAGQLDNRYYTEAEVDASQAVQDGRLDNLEALPTPVTDHGGLTGLSGDDHPQYHNDARGDARYYTQASADLTFALIGHNHDLDYADINHNHDSDYAPIVHVHAIADVTGLQTALDGKASLIHTHSIGDVSGLQTALDGKSDVGHTHDDRYYTESESDANFAPIVHSHAAFTLTVDGFVPAPTTAQGYVLSDAGTWIPPDTGPQGPQGPAGADGLGWTGGSYNVTTGIVTFTSDDGLGFSTTDLRGADGATGPQGPQGDQGIQGPQGLKGDTGDTGPQGVKGDTGDTGPQGIQGVKGDTGDTGPQGIQGIQGDPGADGADGATGPAGPTAISADAGNVIGLGTDSLTFWDGDYNDLINTPVAGVSHWDKTGDDIVNNNIGNVRIGGASGFGKLSVSDGGDAQFRVLVDSPNAGATLQVGSNAFGWGGLGFDASQHIFEVTDVEIMRISNNGRVGIGASNPGTKLDVAGSTTEVPLRARISDLVNNTSGQAIELLANNAAGKATIDFIRGAASTYGGIGFSVSNGGVLSEAMRITDAGNITTSGAFTASGNVTAFSDRRLKDNLEIIPDALDKVNQLNGYTYTRNDMDDDASAGVVAQEVQEVLPEAVKDGEYLSVNDAAITGLLIEAIKELKAEVADLKRRLGD